MQEVSGFLLLPGTPSVSVVWDPAQEECTPWLTTIGDGLGPCYLLGQDNVRNGNVQIPSLDLWRHRVLLFTSMELFTFHHVRRACPE